MRACFVVLLLLAACQPDEGKDPTAPCLQTGFAAEPEEWALPSGYGPGSDAYPTFGSAFATADCEADPTAPIGHLRDLTGDGRLDLVVTDTCDGQVPEGVWWVHVGEAAGFAAERTDWRLPTGYEGAVELFPDAEGRAGGGCDEDGAAYAPAFFLSDLTGDERPDLVVAADCAQPAVGDTVWKVHAGGDGGFAESATDWRLPASYGIDGVLPFMPYEMRGYCSEAIPTSFLSDIDVDGHKDLVVTQWSTDCETYTVGTDHWLVHFGDDGGFAETGTRWNLPAGYDPVNTRIFTSTASDEPYCEGDHTHPAYFVDFVDGDDWPDLVVTRTCEDTGVGEAHWLVHLGGADGFAAGAVEWTLPTWLVAHDEPTFPTRDRWGPAGTEPPYIVEEWDGDPALDLLLVVDMNDSGLRWDLHPGGDGAFGEAVPWSLPAVEGAAYEDFASLLDVWMDCSREESTRSFGILDLDGDHRYDLVSHGACDDETLGRERWAYYPGICSE